MSLTIVDGASAVALDKITLAAIRQCDTVSFHRRPDGAAYVSVTKKCKPTVADPFAPSERSVDLPCLSRLTDYRRDTTGIPDRDSNSWRGFAWISSAKFSPEWVTVAHLLKAGDVLCLHFHADARSNDAMRSAGFAADYFTLEVIRGDMRLSFELDQYNGDRNNPYRMVTG